MQVLHFYIRIGIGSYYICLTFYQIEKPKCYFEN